MKQNKYDTIKQLPQDCKVLPVSQFAREYGFNSAAYVHTKYDRYKFGYLSPRTGRALSAPYPGYDIVSYMGTCWVIVNNLQKPKNTKKK